MGTYILNIYDSASRYNSLKSGWGFSCYIEHNDKKILFDTGADPYKLSYNLDKLKINTNALDFVVLSHAHWDHIGGLWYLIKQNTKIVIYFPSSFSNNFKKELTKEQIKFVQVQNIISVENYGNIFVGPEIKANGITEIGLTLRSVQGLIIITGCAHPGIVHMLEEVKDKVSEKIYLVLGGFHLYDKSADEIQSIIKEFKRIGVENVAPCHCTGERAIKVFRQAFSAHYIEFSAVGQNWRIS